jgi:Amidases related to nicotinamidase
MDALAGDWRHICVDMQRMFAEDTPWHVPWMSVVSPQVIEVVERHAERTIFTRFLTPRNIGEAPGMWRTYYEKWREMTLDHLPPEMLEIVPSLARFCPPALVLDKATYSPWMDGRLHEHLRKTGVATVVITGGETDVCLLATALGAIDLGYRVIVLKDAVCSGVDETHDASLKLLGDRFSVQLDLVRTEEFLSLMQ